MIAESHCTGCSACVNICPKQCIEIAPNEEGFYRLVVHASSCIQCNACTSVCPVEKKNKTETVEKVFAAYILNQDIRRDSSSGGLFSEIALQILAQNGAVFGAAYIDVLKVAHICVETIDELHKLRGAKYAQSDLGTCFTDILSRLKAGQKVLFSGTPCQVAGLNAFLRKPYSNLFTIDFVCHGVPSPLVWEKYVQYRADKDNGGVLPNAINLRSKSTGWSRYQYSNEYLYPNGTKYSAKSGEDLFMCLFVGDYINRESCADCHFKGYQRCSDLTLGDFWGIWDVAPEMDDNKGTSLVLVHSAAGDEMLHQLVNRIALKEVSLDQASKQNPSLLYSSPAKEDREKILNLCINGEFETVRKYLDEQQEKPRKTTLGDFVKQFLCKAKRFMS